MAASGNSRGSVNVRKWLIFSFPGCLPLESPSPRPALGYPVVARAARHTGGHNSSRRNYETTAIPSGAAPARQGIRRNVTAHTTPAGS